MSETTGVSEDSALDIAHSPSLANWRLPSGEAARELARDVVLDCGWGLLIFGHTFRNDEALADALCREHPGRRNVALYLRDPHVLLALRPQELFLDPSHTYRLPLDRAPEPQAPHGVVVRPLSEPNDPEEMERLLLAAGMVPVPSAFARRHRENERLRYLVAQDECSGDLLGTVTGVDHVAAFGDPERGSSLWTLAVDPQARQPGIGEALVAHLAREFEMRGRRFMDLSVLASNASAISLYEKLGFERVPAFCVKHKQNPVNEPLFMPPDRPKLNPYATIIVDEALRRGIMVDIVDSEYGYFRLSWGGRSILCRESLSDLTSAVALTRCQDKRVTLRVWRGAGLPVPEQTAASSQEENEGFLERHGRVVVKPVADEQGHGVSVDVRTARELHQAVDLARRYGEAVIEQWVAGQDLRVIVIGAEVVAAAVRRPPSVVGDGKHTVEELIAKQSRRRAAATGGESRVPIDAETLRCLRSEALALEDVLDVGREVSVRKTANLHAGGTIHDVTERLHPGLREASIEAARLLEMPVVGLDLLVKDPASEEFVLIEANERPGLANHEPQPTAQRFVDLLFGSFANGPAEE